MTDVFISYKREDRERCAALAEALRQLDLTVWFDAQIEPGMTFDREIERELKRAKAVLVLWSARSVDSDWVRNEARVGRAADKLVAVKLDECDLPLEFMASQAALLPELDRNEAPNEQWFSVIGRIGRLVERPGLLPFVEAQGAGRADLWQEWLAAYPGDPLAAKAGRYLAALGVPVPDVQPVPQPVAEPIRQAAPPPVAVAEPAAAKSRLPVLLGGALAGVALLALGVALWPNRGELDPAPAPVASASGPVAGEAGAPASPSATPVAAGDMPAAQGAPADTTPAVPAPVAAPTQPPVQAVAEQPAAAASCEAGPYVVPLGADPNANMAEGQAVLGAAAQAYQRGCRGRAIRIRGVAESGPEAMQAMRRRANAVAGYLAQQGLPRDRMEITVVDQARARGGGGQRIVVGFGG